MYSVELLISGTHAAFASVGLYYSIRIHQSSGGYLADHGRLTFHQMLVAVFFFLMTVGGVLMVVSPFAGPVHGSWVIYAALLGFVIFMAGIEVLETSRKRKEPPVDYTLEAVEDVRRQIAANFA